MTESHPDDPGPAAPGTSTRRLIVTPGSAVKARKLVWWEFGLILQYAINLLAAREGKGKSTVASSWAARETRNGGVVMWIGTEESRESAIVPRLMAAGADMDRIIFVDVQTDLGTGALMFPLDLGRIEGVIREYNVTMLFLDPAKAVVPPGFSGNDDIAVRQYLEPIAALADRCKVTIIGLAHFGKRQGADSGQLMLGSVAWSQVARCVLSIAEDSDTGDRVLTNTKANYVGTDRSVGFRITSTTIDTDDGPTEIGAVQWLGDTTIDARDLLAGDDGGTDVSERTAAEHWLTDYLTVNGPTPSKTVKTEAAKEKISDATLKRAKKKIGVIDKSEGFPRITIWDLPSRLNSQSAHPVAQEREPTEPTELDQRKQDEPTGMDSQLAHAKMSEPTGEPTAEICRHCGELLVYADDLRDGYHSSNARCVKAQQTHRHLQAVPPSRDGSCWAWGARYVTEHQAAGARTLRSAVAVPDGEAEGFERAAIMSAINRIPGVTVIARDGTGVTWSITGETGSTYEPVSAFIERYITATFGAAAGTVDKTDYRSKGEAAGFEWENLRKSIRNHPRIETVNGATGSRRHTSWAVLPGTREGLGA